MALWLVLVRFSALCHSTCGERDRLRLRAASPVWEPSGLSLRPVSLLPDVPALLGPGGLGFGEPRRKVLR